MSDLIDARELAEMIGYRTPRAALAWARRHGIKVHEFSRKHVRISRSSVLEWLRRDGLREGELNCATDDIPSG